jgi:hypothetical protein
MKSEIADVWKRKNLWNNEAKDIPISIGIEIESEINKKYKIEHQNQLHI